MFKLVRCPESGNLEMVECVDTPLGSLIHRCTRFRPSCALRCARDCAAEIDQDTRSRRVTVPLRVLEPASIPDDPVQANGGDWILDRCDEDWIP
jgi:hypothetical protein